MHATGETRLDEGSGLNGARASVRAGSRRGVVVPLRPGNAGGGKGPCFWCAFDGGEEAVIGDEPGNTRTDPDPPEEALSQGEGGTGRPLLPALRQDPSRRHSAPRLCAGPIQRRRTWGGRGQLRDDRGAGAGELAGRAPGRPDRE